MPSVAIWFDYASPYAYLGTTQIERVARDAGASLVWRPFLLGALFRAIGTPMVPIAAAPEPKRRFLEQDQQRWARHWGVPLRAPSRFPLRTVQALRLTVLAPGDRTAPLVHRIMRAAWVEDADVESEDVLRACAREAGVPPELVDGARGPEAKDLLRAATDEAIALGVPGAPSFVVGDQLFWGQDRLDFVAKALGGWRVTVG